MMDDQEIVETDVISAGGLKLLFSGVTKTVAVKQAQGGLLHSSSPEAGAVKEILHDVSGAAHSGEILAIMGPSGSGKTSLLDVLAGRSGFRSGAVTLNTRPLSKEMKRSIAYVTQEDLFFAHLTVRDQLTYTALLRLPRTWNRGRKDEAVNKVIQRLRLEKCADTPIMLISGGEKKRTNVGTELLTNPRMILLDEPTSGLDSTSAVALIATLKSLAAEGRTVLTSIHQPSSAVFMTFDSVLLLADGFVVYSGSPGESLGYLDSLSLPCPKGYNAADFWMDLLVVDSGVDDLGGSSCLPKEPKEEDKAADKDDAEVAVVSTRSRLIAAWDSEKGAALVDNARSNLMTSEEVISSAGQKSYEAAYTTQLTVLMHRSMKNSRSALFTPVNFVKSVVLSIIVGLCWFQMEQTEEYVDDRSGFMFFAMTYWVFDSMFGAMLAFPSEKLIIDRERSSGSYHLSAYFLAKTISELPCRLLMPCIYILIAYWMAGMNPTAGAFFGFAITELMAVLVGESLGLLIGACVPDFEKAIMVMTLVSLALMLTGGFFVQNIPSFFNWIQYLSPFKYAYDACIIFEFTGVKTPCDGSGVLPDCEGLSQGFVNGRDVIDYLGVEGSIGFNLGMLVALFVAARAAAYVALRRQSATRARQ